MTLVVRKLSPEETIARFPKRGHMDLTEYEALFEGLEDGDGYTVELNGMSTRQLKRRLGQAVKRKIGPTVSLRYDVDEDADPPVVAFILRTNPAKRTEGSRRKKG